MDSKKIEAFYNSIIEGKEEISKIFEDYLDEIKKVDLTNLQSEFHKKLRKQFETVKSNVSESGFEENLNIPPNIKERVQISTLIFTLMVLGAKYSKEVYERAKTIRTQLQTEKLIYS